MNKVEIYEWQLKNIQDCLRIVSRVLDSSKKVTSLDRDIVQSQEYVKNALEKI